MAEQMVKVASFGTVEEAHLAKNALEAEGIRAALEDEASVGMFWYLGNAFGGIKLLVTEEEVPHAQRVLEHIDADGDEGSTQITEKPPADVGPKAPEEPEVHVTAVRPEPGEEPEVADAGDDGPDELESPGEVMANRAFRAALVGLVLWPVTLYSLYLLLGLLRWEGELPESAHRKMLWATVFDCVVVGLCALFFVLLR
ncbi:hypothetical protein AYO40_05355 [Planctomycetaceae bacterium SCGC AG-212-D15]|nr:hypothetical protein AYO40_05355 [Planctomycetaceae bacterium SCGC AG-212-D15]